MPERLRGDRGGYFSDGSVDLKAAQHCDPRWSSKGGLSGPTPTAADPYRSPGGHERRSHGEDRKARARMDVQKSARRGGHGSDRHHGEADRGHGHTEFPTGGGPGQDADAGRCYGTYT
ncbi:hypothetical protein GCM10027162_30320 [Streptomyces incanus]